MWIAWTAVLLTSSYAKGAAAPTSDLDPLPIMSLAKAVTPDDDTLERHLRLIE
jgi:hypothetical protein